MDRLRLENSRLEAEVARLQGALASLTEERRRPATDLVAFGGLTLKRIDRCAELDGRILRLLPREYAVCQTLALAGGETVATATLERQVLAGSSAGSTNVIAVHVSRLRAKLAGGSVAIATERRSGYRLVLAQDAPGSSDS